MGMYTELHLNVELKRDTPTQVIEALKRMLGESQTDPDIGHPLFGTTRWRHMLTCDSYYFAADTHSTLRWDNISMAYYLCIRCNLKNYDAEIQHFIDWIMPWVLADPGDFLGFYRYEESEDPTLIRKVPS